MKRRREHAIPMARPEMFTIENNLFPRRFLTAILRWLLNINETF
jgi:hypothetical protein